MKNPCLLRSEKLEQAVSKRNRIIDIHHAYLEGNLQKQDSVAISLKPSLAIGTSLQFQGIVKAVLYVDEE